MRSSNRGASPPKRSPGGSCWVVFSRGSSPVCLSVRALEDCQSQLDPGSLSERQTSSTRKGQDIVAQRVTQSMSAHQEQTYRKRFDLEACMLVNNLAHNPSRTTCIARRATIMYDSLVRQICLRFQKTCAHFQFLEESSKDT